MMILSNAGSPDRRSNSCGLHRFAHVVCTYHIRPIRDGDAMSGDRPWKPLFKRRVAAFLSDYPFARGRDQQRAFADAQLTHIGEESQVLFMRLAKTDAGVQTNTLTWDTPLTQDVQLFDEVLTYGDNYIGINAGVVHHDTSAVGSCSNVDHRRVIEARHVIENLHAIFERRRRNLWVERVNRHWNIQSIAELLQYGQQSFKLLLRGDPGVAGARGLRTDVDDIRTLVPHLQSMSHRTFRGKEEPPVRKGIGRDIQDAYD